MGLDALCAIHDGQRVEIGQRAISDNGSSLRTVLPREICRARGLEGGDRVMIEYDQKRDEIVIPLGGGETDE